MTSQSKRKKKPTQVQRFSKFDSAAIGNVSKSSGTQVILSWGRKVRMM